MNALGVAQVARSAGFIGDGLVTAVAVALAESGGDPGATGHNPGSVDRGLWQINDLYHPEVVDACAYDAACCAAAAYRISAGGADWRPWSTYQSGAYQAYLAAAHTAVGELTATSAAPAPTSTNSSGPNWGGLALLAVAGVAVLWALS